MSLNFKANMYIEIRDLWIDKHYFGFRYIVYVDGQLRASNFYEDSHNWPEPKEYEKLLNSGKAAILALENCVENIF